MGNVIKNALWKRRLDGLFHVWNDNKGARSGFHASSLLAHATVGTSKYCHREHVLGTRYERDTPEIDAPLLRIFLAGWTIHEKWQKLALDAGMALYNETEHLINLDSLSNISILPGEYRYITGLGKRYHIEYEPSKIALSFTPDIILEVDGEQYICEIKGYGHETYEKIASNPEMNPKYQDALRQANLYMHLTGIYKAVLIFEDKNTQNFLAFEVEYDRELVLPYVQRSKDLLRCLKENEINHRLVKGVCKDENSGRAKNCPVSDVCFHPEKRFERLLK